MSSLPMLTAGGSIALQLLRAMRIDTIERAVPILALWARPPRLTAADLRGILAELDHDTDDEEGNP